MKNSNFVLSVDSFLNKDANRCIPTLQAILVEAGLLLNTDKNLYTRLEIEDNRFTVKNLTGDGEILIAVDMVNGKLDTGKISINTPRGRLNILSIVRKRIVVNSARLALIAIDVEKLYNEYNNELQKHDLRCELESKVQSLKKELCELDQTDTTRVVSLAITQLKAQLKDAKKQLRTLK